MEGFINITTMATFTATFTYPDSKQADLRDTLALAFNYNSVIPNPNYTVGSQEPETIPNPMTKGQYIQHVINDHLRKYVKNTYERQKQIIAEQSIEKLDTNI